MNRLYIIVPLLCIAQSTHIVAVHPRTISGAALTIGGVSLITKTVYTINTRAKQIPNASYTKRMKQFWKNCSRRDIAQLLAGGSLTIAGVILLTSSRTTAKKRIASQDASIHYREASAHQIEKTVLPQPHKASKKEREMAQPSRNIQNRSEKLKQTPPSNKKNNDSVLNVLISKIPHIAPRQSNTVQENSEWDDNNYDISNEQSIARSSSSSERAQTSTSSQSHHIPISEPAVISSNHNPHQNEIALSLSARRISLADTWERDNRQ